ncbi:MAG: RloB family protein [Treponemataceae bacterium]|nr:RloB family protein [Treponemataceae bacterium]
MPKKRKQPGTRKYEKVIYILCEGADKHSEPAYFSSLIKNNPIKGNRVKVDIVKTEKNTGRELVQEASKKIEKDFKNIDEAWVVYDQDGYTKHAETFELAKTKNVNIAFTATAFEYWILLHYEYTSAIFPKSEDIIRYMTQKKYIDYKKASCDVYEKTANKLEIAMTNAHRLRRDKEITDYNIPIYKRNPYTNIDVLIEKILAESKK